MNSPQTPLGKRAALSMQTSLETPMKVDWASSGVFIHGTLEDQRDVVSSDLGASIPEVGINFMLGNLLPQALGGGLNETMTLAALQSRGEWIEDRGWKPFNGRIPSSMDDTEDKIYNKRMEHIVMSIIRLAIFNQHTPVRGIGIGTSPWVSPVSRSNVKTRPDACGLLETYNLIHTSNWYKPLISVPDYHWFNIAYTLEYKKYDNIKSRNDNVLKMLWNLHHIMNVDHRRRFTFGITIEDTTARVWFCCRQIVVVSTPFDFMTEPMRFIRIFTSLHYSEQAAVGYDPTMTYKWNEKVGKLQLEILVHKKDSNVKPRKYLTTGNIISDESQIIRSRATRVYEAYEINDNSKSLVVIKDMWVDANRKLEADILEDILQNATEDEKSLFLTVLQHGIVKVHDRNDVTEGLIIRSAKFSSGGHGAGAAPDLQPGAFLIQQRSDPVGPSGSSTYHNAIHFSEVNLISTNVLPNSISPRPSAQLPKQHPSSKVHYRIVFKERGISLHHMSLQREIKLSGTLIPVFKDIARALQVMWKKQYVHRDVSAANIVIYKNRARLIDLEFAKKFGTPASSAFRTANYSFMACEILSGMCIGASKFTAPIYNPLHDLESLWLIGVWFTFCHYTARALNEADTSRMKKVIQSIHNLGNSLFATEGRSSMPNKENRVSALTVGLPFLAEEFEAHGVYFPVGVAEFCVILENLRQKLYDHSISCHPLKLSYFYTPSFTLYDDLEADISASGLLQGNGQPVTADHILWPIKDLMNQMNITAD